MKKVLIITNEFIPYSKSLGGIIRVLSFADYLTKNNIEVHILTSKNRLKNGQGGYITTDETRNFSRKNYLGSIGVILVGS